MNSRKITKTILTTNQGLIQNNIPDDIIGLIFDFTGNIWEHVDSVDHNKYIFFISNIQYKYKQKYPADLENAYFCNVCKSSFQSKKIIGNHINSKLHKNNLKRYKKETLEEVKEYIENDINDSHWYSNICGFEIEPVEYEVEVVCNTKYKFKHFENKKIRIQVTL